MQLTRKKDKSDKKDKKDNENQIENQIEQPADKKKKISLASKPKIKKSKPLPAFIAIDIGSREVKILEGQFRNLKLNVQKAISDVLPNGWVYDGKILEVDKVAGHLIQMLSRNAMKPANAVITMNSTEMIQRELVVPRVADSELLGLVTYEIAKFLPIDPSSYVIQYNVIEEFLNKDNVIQLRVNVCAMPKFISKNYADLLNKLKIKPLELNIHSSSIEKIMKVEMLHNSTLAKGCNAIIDIGHTNINVMLFNDGNFIFNRLLDVGGSKLDEILINSADVDHVEAEKLKKFNLSKLSVVDIYKQYSLTGFMEREALNTQELITQETIIAIDNWISNIDAVIKYYTSRNNENVVDNVYIYGGSTFIRDIDKLIEQKLNIKTSRLDFLHLLEGSIDSKIISTYMNAIGAKIRL